MKTIAIIAALLAAPLLAQDEKGKITELEAEKLLRVTTQMEYLKIKVQADLESLTREHNAIVEQICLRAGIPTDKCSLDLKARTATSIPVAKAPEEQAAPANGN